MFSFAVLFCVASQLPRAYVQDTSEVLGDFSTHVSPHSEVPFYTESVAHSEAPVHSGTAPHSKASTHSEVPPGSVHSEHSPHSEPAVHSEVPSHLESTKYTPHSEPLEYSKDPQHAEATPHSEAPLAKTTFASLFITPMPRKLMTLPPELRATASPSLRPELIIFETDKLLWPFWVDIKLVKPFIKNKKGEVFDQVGRPLTLYSEVPDILMTLHKENYTLAIASRSHDSENTRKLLELFDIAKFFQHVVILPGEKSYQFNVLKELSYIEFEGMLNFDGEDKNILATESLGIPSILCRFGMDKKSLKLGLERFADKKKHDLDEMVRV